MYTKEEATLVRQKFWTSFGKYMQPVPASTGERVNWINYTTGIKGITFKMNADNASAYVAIEISLTDKIIQKQYFDCLIGIKKHFIKIVGKGWEISECHITENRNEVSIAITELKNIKIFREADWPAIISFLKKHIIALDLFWNEWKPAFENIN